MAHLFSEHASQAVSRDSEAALIPLEKRATLAQPLRQNASKPARIFTGADNRAWDGLLKLLGKNIRWKKSQQRRRVGCLRKQGALSTGHVEKWCGYQDEGQKERSLGTAQNPL